MKLTRRRVAAGLAVAWAALSLGCDRPSMLSPAGPAARSLARLGWPILIAFTLVTAVMWVLIAIAATRRPGTLAEHAPIEAKDGIGGMILGGFLVPTVVFAAVFVATLRTMSAMPIDHSGGAREMPPADIVVTGQQWWWKAEYHPGTLQEQFTTANEIHVPVGRPVEIELVSRDVIHSFWAPSLHGKVDLVPGLVNHVRIQADTPGVYPGGCAEFCGRQHARMKFLVVAETPEAYAQWLEAERQPAAAPATDEARRGQDLFMTRACVLCHTVRGTLAHGAVGPDLTHLGARRTLAAASQPKDIATLHAWVVDAPSLKPGVRMPALNEFTGRELHDLVAYLDGLR
jgi:cytochrome c oxidase subunit II